MQGPASAGLSAAFELDAAGNPGEAFNVLKRASAGGDLPAMTELGHRLLIGDRAPKMVEHALSLISGAARGGEGRALARMAALTAAGAYVPQDWHGRAAAAGRRRAGRRCRSARPAGHACSLRMRRRRTGRGRLAARCRTGCAGRLAGRGAGHRAGAARGTCVCSCAGGCLRLADRAGAQPAARALVYDALEQARDGARDAHQQRGEFRLRQPRCGAVPGAGAHGGHLPAAAAAARGAHGAALFARASRSGRTSTSSTPPPRTTSSRSASRDSG